MFRVIFVERRRFVTCFVWYFSQDEVKHSFLCTYRLNHPLENLLRMVRWMRWHCSPDTGFEIRPLVVWGRTRYHSVTEAPHNIESLRVSGEETFCFFEIWRAGWGSNPRSPTFQAGRFNHCTRAQVKAVCCRLCGVDNLSSKHDILNQRKINVGPPSAALVQH